MQRIGDDQQFHQIVVGRERRRLQDEDVFAADVFVDLDEDLVVVEAADRSVGERQLEVVRNGLGQGGVRVAGDEFHRARPRCLGIAGCLSPGADPRNAPYDAMMNAI
jgi:hypothetical protein